MIWFFYYYYYYYYLFIYLFLVRWFKTNNQRNMITWIRIRLDSGEVVTFIFFIFITSLYDFMHDVNIFDTTIIIKTAMKCSYMSPKTNVEFVWIFSGHHTIRALSILDIDFYIHASFIDILMDMGSRTSN